MDVIIPIVFYAISLYIAYLIITVAVRHGINSSVIGKVMKEKYGIEEKFYPKDDLDKN